MTDQMTRNYGTDSYVVNPSDHEPPECPPEDVYTLTLMGIKSIGLGKPFQGKEPQVQFTLDFKIDAPDPDSAQGEWHHFDLIGWYTPIMHYDPNLPDYSGQTYTEPNMYKLVRALNGGTPLSLEVDRDPISGKAFFAPYDAAALLRPFFGRTFRSVVGPAPSGWPRLKGDPMPVPQPGTGRRRGAARTNDAIPQPELVGVAAGGGEDIEDPFPGSEDL